MFNVFFLLLWMPAVTASSSLFSSPTYVKCSEDADCTRDVLTQVDEAVVWAKKVELDCSQLQADASILTLDWFDDELVATRAGTLHLPALADRHVWIGPLVGQAGTLSAVWNEACDPDVFHLSVGLNSDAAAQTYTIRTLPCGGLHDADQCTWVTVFYMEAKDELDGTAVQWYRRQRERQLQLQSLSSDAYAVDVQLLATMSDAERAALPTAAGGRKVIMPSGTQLDNGSIVQVLWLYTPQTRARYGDTGIQSMIAAGVASANLALKNSVVPVRIRCVGVFALENYYAESHTQTLADMNAGTIAGLLQKRNRYRADLVQMIIEDPTYCGLGNIMYYASPSFEQFAYSTVYSACFSSLSHIHEIGHNFGAQHDSENAAGGATQFAYALGHRYCDTEGSFRSVMSYSCLNSTRVPYFSNPNITYLNLPTGTEEHNNAEVLRNNRFVVANFRR